MGEVCERHAVIEALCGCLAQENERTRWCAVQALARLGAREAVPVLVAKLGRDPDPDVRMEIAAALGTLATKTAVAPLMTALQDDPDGNVRLEACRALGTIHDPRVVGALMTCLQADTIVGLDDWDTEDDIGFDVAWVLQREALERLGTLGDSRAVDAVIQLIASEDYDDLQEPGLRVLATLGGKRALAYVLRQLRRGSDTGRQRAARALAHTADTAVLAPLTAALADRDADVRIAAGWSLAHRQHADVLSSLTTLLNDPSAAVRCEAVAMVASYGDETAAEHLLPLLSDPQPAVKQRAIQVLGEWGEQRAVGPMLALLARAGHDEVTASALLKALGQLASAEALQPVCQLLRDDRTLSTIRLQAALALAALLPEAQAQREEANDDGQQPTSTEPDLIALLTTLAQDANPHVCRVALLALGKLGEDAASAVLLKALRGELLESPQDVPTPDPGQDESGAPDFPTSTLAAIQAAQAVHAAPALGERQRTMQRHAASVLRDLNVAGAYEALGIAAESDDAGVRAEALLSLGHLGGPESFDVVRQGCIAPSRDVRLAAIEALRRFATEDICDLLVDLLRVEPDPLVVGAILAVLGTHGDARVTAAIVSKLHDEDRHVQRAALEALARLGDRTAIEAIRPLLFANGGELCHDAVRALQRLQDTGVGTLLLATLSQPEEDEHHWMAIEALVTLYGHA